MNPQETKKPPVLVQVLFALGILGFIIGTFLSLVMISLGSNSMFGAFGDMVQAIGFGILLMMLFILWLLLKVRAGKLWALVVYSVLSVLGITSVVSSRSDNAQLSITAQVVTGLLLLGVWIKNRDYFA